MGKKENIIWKRTADMHMNMNGFSNVTMLRICGLGLSYANGVHRLVSVCICKVYCYLDEGVVMLFLKYNVKRLEQYCITYFLFVCC